MVTLTDEEKAALKNQEYMASLSRATHMTKREAFAMAAMQGMLAKGAAQSMTHDEYRMLAKWSVAQADALIEALKETP